MKIRKKIIIFLTITIMSSVTMTKTYGTEKKDFFSQKKDNFISGELTNPSELSYENIAINYLKSVESKTKKELNKKNLLNSNQTDTGVSNINESTQDISYKVDSTDKFGLNYVLEIEQQYKDFPIYGSSQKVVIQNDGVIKSVSGKDISKELKFSSKMNFNKIDEDKALNHALDAVNLDISNLEKYEIEKIAFIENGKAKATYLVKAAFVNPISANWVIVVDAVNGEILHKYNTIDNNKNAISDKKDNINFDTSKFDYLDSFISSIMFKKVKNKGVGLYTGECEFMASKFLNNYYMVNQDYGIWTINGNELFFETDSDGIWNTKKQSLPVDTHHNFELIYEFFENEFNRDSYDNSGGTIRNVTTFLSSKNNAYYHPLLKSFFFLEGDDELFGDLTSLGIVAHEYTHGITDAESGLVYMNESGAINEAYSDIFATLIEFSYDENSNWLIGEKVYTPSIENDALRSMSNPKMFGHPDHIKDKLITEEDMGGVHTNSGIINKVAYLISEGGTHYNIKVNGIGKEKLGKIFYDALMKYVVESTDFSDLKTCIIQSTADLYGSESQEIVTVTKAFDSVGIVN